MIVLKKLFNYALLIFASYIILAVAPLSSRGFVFEEVGKQKDGLYKPSLDLNLKMK